MSIFDIMDNNFKQENTVYTAKTFMLYEMHHSVKMTEMYVISQKKRFI